MALTKMEFYIIALFVFVVIPTSFGLVCQNLALNDKVVLNEPSQQFITDYTNQLSQQNLTALIQDENSNLKSDDILTGDQGAIEDFKDNFMANLNYFRIKVSKFQNFIKLLYNAPSFFIMVLGFSDGEFSWLINLFNVVIFISISVLILREIK